MKTHIAFGLAVSALAMSAYAEEAKAAEELKSPEVSISGEAEFDVYSGDVLNDDKVNHSYASTFDLNFDVKFNDNWSAYVGLEADGEAATDLESVYNGAFIQYSKGEKFAVKAGDLTFSEGAFLNYYGYDDPADDAAGMKEHDIRGVELDYGGLVFGVGFGRGDNDNQICDEEEGEVTCVGVAYDAHLAYELGLGEQLIRPYLDYKSYQEKDHNEVHAGIDANLKFGGLAFHAVYGLHSAYLGDDDASNMSHAFLAEPSFEFGAFNVKATAFYALIDEDAKDEAEFDAPEYLFGYIEPSFALTGAVTVGVPVEYHTNSLDKDSDLESVDAGARVYFAPVEGLEMTGFAMVKVPLGDDYGDDDDVGLTLGLETVFAF